MACENIRTFFYVFLRFFKIQKHLTFYVFLSCCTRFLEHWYVANLNRPIFTCAKDTWKPPPHSQSWQGSIPQHSFRHVRIWRWSILNVIGPLMVGRLDDVAVNGCFVFHFYAFSLRYVLRVNDLEWSFCVDHTGCPPGNLKESTPKHTRTRVSLYLCDHKKRFLCWPQSKFSFSHQVSAKSADNLVVSINMTMGLFIYTVC